MLYTTLTKAQYDASSDEIKSHYKLKADGSNYTLDLSGSTERESQLETQITQLSRDVNNARNDAQLSKAAAEASEDKYKTQYETQVKDLTEKVNALEGTQAESHRSTLIESIATKFTRPELFRKVLQDHITVEMKDGKPVETIVDAAGKPITLEALSDVYCKNKDYSAMLVATASTPTFNQGNGAGAAGAANTTTVNTPTPAGKPSYEDCVKYNAQGKPYVVDSANMTPAYLERFADEATQETT